MTRNNIQLRLFHHLLVSKLRHSLRRLPTIDPIRDDLANFHPQMPETTTGNQLRHREIGTTARQSTVTISK
jgi:hypothetical protein